MGKSFYEGLKYIRLDVDIHNNKKVEKMEARHGDAGFAFMIKLWCRVYADSYYLELDDDIIASFCRKVLNKTVEEFNVMLRSAIEFHIFDKKIFETYNVLTSAGMQRRYLHITKRWKKVLFIPEFGCKNVDINPYHLFICNKAGHIIKEKHPKEVPGSRPPANKKPEKEVVEKPPVEVKPVPATEFINAPKFINTGKIPTDEIHRFCELNYSEQNEKFKKQASEEWFNSFRDFNRTIDEDFPQIRISEFQLNIEKFIKLFSEPIDGKLITPKELNMAVERLAGNGVKEGFNIYLKLRDYITYIREPKTKTKNASSKESVQPSKTGFGSL